MTQILKNIFKLLTIFDFVIKLNNIQTCLLEYMENIIHYQEDIIIFLIIWDSTLHEILYTPSINVYNLLRNVQNALKLL